MEEISNVTLIIIVLVIIIVIAFCFDFFLRKFVFHFLFGRRPRDINGKHVVVSSKKLI